MTDSTCLEAVVACRSAVSMIFGIRKEGFLIPSTIAPNDVRTIMAESICPKKGVSDKTLNKQNVNSVAVT